MLRASMNTPLPAVEFRHRHCSHIEQTLVRSKDGILRRDLQALHTSLLKQHGCDCRMSPNADAIFEIVPPRSSLASQQLKIQTPQVYTPQLAQLFRGIAVDSLQQEV